MAIEAWEVPDSRGGKNSPGKESARKFDYMVTGTNDENAAISAVEAIAPATYTVSTGILVPGDVDPRFLGHEAWMISVNYISKEKKDEKEEKPPGEGTFAWDTTGNTQHITISKETLDSTSTSLTEAPFDFARAIGVNGDSIDGVDVVVPGLQLQIDWTLEQASVTMDYVRTIRDLTGTVNNATWKGWAAGELLFLGSSGKESTNGSVSATFYFLASKNTDAVDLPPDMIDTLAKKGHEYLWLYFRAEDDAGSIIRTPAFAYIERVYDEADFTALGIGT